MALAEEHRPRSLGEIVGQPVDKIRRRLNGTKTPNFLLYGPPGTGKTTAARCTAQELQGNSNAYLELNAADVGVDDIRTRVDRAGRQLTLQGHPPVVVLDEMETMSYDAQQALKKRMEEYPAVFILLTNDDPPAKVNDALVDRCVTLEFGKLDVDVIVERLEEIARREQLDVPDGQFRNMAVAANGSMRSALQALDELRNIQRPSTGGWQSLSDFQREENESLRF